MNRPYRRAEATPVDGGFTVMLDDRAAKTPGRQPLILPSAALADAVVAEWLAQGDKIRPETMPYTRLAATTIDRVAVQRDSVIDETAAYAATDLLCHRAETPAELVERQTAAWQPVLDWLAARHGARLKATRGVVPVAQPPDALATLRALIADFDDSTLCALHTLTAASGSLVLALAVADGHIDGESVWRSSQVDEEFQIETWGEDTEATKRRRAVHDDILAAARFLDLCRR